MQLMTAVPTRVSLRPSMHTHSLVEILQREHQEGTVHIRELSEAARSIQQNGFTVSAFEQLALSIRWLNTSVRRHMQKEEQHLFPLLVAEQYDLVNHLLVQHHELSTAFTQLMDAVSDVEEGTLRGSILQELVLAADHVVKLLEEHMAEESAVAFPLVIKILSSKAPK